MDNPIDEIKKLLGSEKLIVGADETIKALRSGKLEKIFIATNTKPEIKEDLQRFGELAKVAITELAIPNDELGTACKKPFAISVLGILQ